MRIKLTVAYDGTNYHGWQIQPNGITIEECINDAIYSVFKQESTVIGASRTDAGVHALGNVCVFDIKTQMDPSKIAFALNSKLPEDIRIRESIEVPLDFNPRFNAIEKTYEYHIYNDKINIPTQRLYSYFFHRPLDVEKMNLAAQYLKGEHDFTSYASIHSQTDNFVRTIYDIGVLSDFENHIIIRIRGNGFLYNMVRIIAGTLIKVGVGAFGPDDVDRILKAKNREKAGPTAPPQGLILCNIKY